MKDRLLALLREAPIKARHVKAFDFDMTLTQTHTFFDRNILPENNLKSGVPFARDQGELLAIVTDHDDHYFILQHLLILLNYRANIAYQSLSYPIDTHYQCTVYLLGDEGFPIFILSNPKTFRDELKKNSRLTALLAILAEAEIIEPNTPVSYFDDDPTNLEAALSLPRLKNRPDFRCYWVDPSYKETFVACEKTRPQPSSAGFFAGEWGSGEESDSDRLPGWLVQ